MQKITLFQHLVQNAYRVIRKKGNDDIEIDAVGLCVFPLMGNYNVILGLLEYYLYGNVYTKIPAFLYIGGLIIIPILLYFHVMDSRAFVKEYYKKLNPKRRSIYLYVFITYYVLSVSLIFLVRYLIVSRMI
jgi:hypothetical protein